MLCTWCRCRSLQCTVVRVVGCYSCVEGSSHMILLFQNFFFKVGNDAVGVEKSTEEEVQHEHLT